MVINRIGPMSVAKLAAVLYGMLGLLIGACVSLVAMVGGFAAGQNQASAFGAMIGIGSIIFFPLLYGVIGFIGTLIAAALYNVAAGIVGGVHVDVT
jgi:hypothetical protein